MIKSLRFDESESTKVFFFSDIHASHEKDFILNPRGFKSASEGKEIIINNWNSKVSNEDICFLLGDTVVGAGQNSETVFDEILRRLNYRELYICPGNHFSGFKQKFESEFNSGNRMDIYQRLTFLVDGVRSVHMIPNYYEIFVNHVPVVLSHYPILSYNGLSRDALHIFGHTHAKLKESRLGKEYLNGRVLEVTPESIGSSPISFSEVMVLIGNKRSIKVDHH